MERSSPQRTQLKGALRNSTGCFEPECLLTLRVTQATAGGASRLRRFAGALDVTVDMTIPSAAGASALLANVVCARPEERLQFR